MSLVLSGKTFYFGVFYFTSGKKLDDESESESERIIGKAEQKCGHWVCIGSRSLIHPFSPLMR